MVNAVGVRTGSRPHRFAANRPKAIAILAQRANMISPGHPGSLDRSHTMERHGDEIEVTSEEASGGTTGHGVRYMLVGGLLLVVAALSAIWITGALIT
jgi:cobalamin biosynthesis Mg chelatase CobN